MLKKKKLVFFFDCSRSSLLHGLFSSCRELGLLQFRYMGFSLWWFPLMGKGGAVGHVGFSTFGFWVLKHRLNSCGTQPQRLCSMWDLPESMSAALAGGFFTTEPSGKPNPGLSRAVLQIKMDIGCVRWNFAPALIYTQRPEVDCLSNQGCSKIWVQPHRQRGCMRNTSGQGDVLRARRPRDDQ